MRFCMKESDKNKHRSTPGTEILNVKVDEY